MEYRELGRLGPVSALALGGGGIGSVWGETSRAEAVATVRAAVDAGITLLDLAPLYGSAEEVVGAAFDGRLPDSVRVLTKCRLGDPPPPEAYDRIRASLIGSLRRLRTDHVDLMLLHGTIVEDAPPDAHPVELGSPSWTSTTTYWEGVVPAMQRLVLEGFVSHWGISAIQLPHAFLDRHPRPDVAECVANAAGRPGGTIPYDPNVPMQETISALRDAGVGTLGVRAVLAGGLVDVPDRALDGLERSDFDSARRFRELARELGTTAAALAHRYALSLAGVDTVVVGVKNRTELKECLDAESAGPLAGEVRELVRATF
jgi:aryl-alcohol dehydrogenase-like predicted oxidoreductase